METTLKRVERFKKKVKIESFPAFFFETSKSHFQIILKSSKT
jgi:hypothetical protein